MKRAAPLAVLLVLGCGGTAHIGEADHYDRPCATTPQPPGGWCASCAGGTSGGFACGAACVSPTTECTAAPGCACNQFKIVP